MKNQPTYQPKQLTNHLPPFISQTFEIDNNYYYYY